MEVNIGKAGEVSLGCKQQVWVGDQSVMQTSFFAGQDLMVIQHSDDYPEIFELHFLGFISTGFNGVDEAKQNAPEFAKAVLAKMSGLIK